MPLKQPLIIPIDGEPYGLNKYRAYELVEDYTYYWKIDGTHYRIHIPAGFKYDGASVPRFVWSIIGLLPDGLGRAAALVHDYLYVHKGALPKGGYQEYVHAPLEPLENNVTPLDPASMEKLVNPPIVGPIWKDSKDVWTRKSSDKMFARLMREGGVPRVRRRLAYRGVRSAGWYWWKYVK